MCETFSTFNIHPYDIQGTVLKKDTGFELRLSLVFPYVTQHVHLNNTVHEMDLIRITGNQLA